MKRATKTHPTTLATGLAALVLFAVSCTSQPVIQPSRDFDRPTDITFVCMGAFEPGGAMATDDGGADTGSSAEAGTPAGGSLVASGRPMRECHPRGTVDVPDSTHHTYAFIPSSSSGELSVIDADKWRFINLDPANFGYNALPLGTLPTQIVASDDGCRVVTANHGSCDLSLVDPSALLAPTLSRDAKTSVTAAGSTIVTNVIPRTKNSGRELRLFAGEVSFIPVGTSKLTKADYLCPGDPNEQWQALATFPSCDLVALLDMPSGEIKKAAYVRRTADGERRRGPRAPRRRRGSRVPRGLQLSARRRVDRCLRRRSTRRGRDGRRRDRRDTGSDEAGATDGGTLEAGMDEAGATEAGTDGQGAAPPADPGDVPYVGPGALRPGPIAIIPESGRAFVGLANAPFVVAFDVATGVLSPAAGGGAIPLEGAIGVNRIRLSIDPYLDKTAGAGSSGISGTFIGNTTFPDRAYLYVIARDGAMHVVQVAHAPESECETNLDPLSIPDPATRRTALANGCIPVDPIHRRPLAIGPGIRPPTPPIDVAVADISPMPADPSETSVSGVHAWMITASGAVYLVNIDPVQRNIAYVVPTGPDPVTGKPISAHVFACLTPTGDCLSEGSSQVFGYAPPPNTLRDRNVLSYTVALDPSEGLPRLDVPSSEPATGPRIESVWTVGSAANETAVTTAALQTEVFFPDLTSVTPQTWTITWQGALMSSPRFEGELQNGGATLQDFGADFCRIGVQPTDLVTVGGCTTNTQCGLGKVCVLGTDGAQAAGALPITGLCLDPGVSEATCDHLLNTVRRYEVTSSHPTALEIVPHKDELVRPSLKPCGPAVAAHADGGATSGPDARPSDAGGADAGADGKDLLGVANSDCNDPLDPSTSTFQCIAGRCLIPCHEVNSTQECRPGRICVPFDVKPGATPKPNQPRDCVSYDCFCADGPDITQDTQAHRDECLGELFPYQATVGRSFLVSGSQTGIPVTQTTATVNGVPTCVPDTTLDPRVADRISMDAPHCQNVAVDPTMLRARAGAIRTWRGNCLPRTCGIDLGAATRRARPEHGRHAEPVLVRRRPQRDRSVRGGRQRRGRTAAARAHPRAVPQPRAPVHDDQPRAAALERVSDSLRRSRRLPAPARDHPEHGRGHDARPHRPRTVRLAPPDGTCHRLGRDPVPLRRRPAAARALTGWRADPRPALAHPSARLCRHDPRRGLAAVVRGPHQQQQPVPDAVAAAARRRSGT